MADKVELRAVIDVKGLTVKDYRASKSSVPELEERRLKKQIKEAKENLEYTLKHNPEEVEHTIKNLLSVKADLKENEVINGSTKSRWYRLSGLDHFPEIDITSKTSDKEIIDAVNAKAQELVDWRQECIDNCIKALDDFYKEGKHNYYLWLVPDPTTVIKVLSSKLESCELYGDPVAGSIERFFNLLKDGYSLDVTFIADNDNGASFIAKEIKIHSYKNID